ncbi:hypothetical protein HDU82_005165 [Entophlyctis luteolus]|nr:hypothetical protein HDU82_005165 [Entophlyctis luteolus]
MTFGVGEGGRISDRKLLQEILDLFKSNGCNEIDTARMYCGGNTEEVLRELGVVAQGFSVHTKVRSEFFMEFLITVYRTQAFPFKAGEHAPDKLKAQFQASLNALGLQKVDVFYLHAPDHSVPYELTLGAVDELYRAGGFVELGLSNYTAWEVTQIYYICKEKGYVLPTLYQGMYNPLTREVERELFPCLNALGLRFYAYNPLCGGLLSGSLRPESNVEAGARFDPKTTQGARYRGRYWNKSYFTAVEIISKALESHPGLSMASASHRWMFHHSKLNQDKGDGVILGVSSIKHAVSNLADCEGSPLPEDVVRAFDLAYEKTKAHQPAYGR